MAGMDRETGAWIAGWDHVQQSLGVIFTTRFHERFLRRWFGSLVPHLLGENLTRDTALRFFGAIGTAIELWEPRFKIVRMRLTAANRKGGAGIEVIGQYLPRGHLGDPTPEGGLRSIILIRGGGGLIVA